MCIQHIENLKKDFNLPIDICPQCQGDGEIVTFCGHDLVEYCHLCEGKGYKRYARIAIVNGEEVTGDYVIKENDVVEFVNKDDNGSANK